VERLLRNYIDFRLNLLDGGSSQTPEDPSEEAAAPAQAVESFDKRRPLGWSMNDQRWPFMEPRHAHSKIDGKRKAQLITEIHVCVLDLERGLKGLADDDLELVYKYHLFQTRTLDELCVERGVASRGSMSRRIERAVNRLVFEMEYGGTR
jgi:hypothetical protein